MKSFLVILLSVPLLLTGIAFSEQDDSLVSHSNVTTIGEVTDHIQSISVTIRSGSGYGSSQGSGVLYVREVEGSRAVFVWTAAHVVDNLRSVKKINGKEIVEFEDADILQELVRDGRTVGEFKLKARVIKWSNYSEGGDDVALLHVYYPEFASVGVTFGEDKVYPMGTDIYHVGSLLGQMGANSLTKGIVSRNGRILDKKVFDQTEATAFPGSSGGGIFTLDGHWIGMVVRGAGEGFNLIVPMRRLYDFCEEYELMWAIDPTVNAPTLREIERDSDIDVDHASAAKKVRQDAAEGAPEEDELGFNAPRKFPFLLEQIPPSPRFVADKKHPFLAVPVTTPHNNGVVNSDTVLDLPPLLR